MLPLSSLIILLTNKVEAALKVCLARVVCLNRLESNNPSTVEFSFPEGAGLITYGIMSPDFTWYSILVLFTRRALTLEINRLAVEYCRVMLFQLF